VSDWLASLARKQNVRAERLGALDLPVLSRYSSKAKYPVNSHRLKVGPVFGQHGLGGMLRFYYRQAA